MIAFNIVDVKNTKEVEDEKRTNENFSPFEYNSKFLFSPNLYKIPQT